VERITTTRSVATDKAGRRPVTAFEPVTGWTALFGFRRGNIPPKRLKLLVRPLDYSRMSSRSE